MNDTLSRTCIVLWPCPQEDPHPALRLDSPHAVREIIQRWDRKRLEHLPKLARVAICRIAVGVIYVDEVQREEALVWACQEAPHWWRALEAGKVQRDHLRKLYEEYLDSGRI